MPAKIQCSGLVTIQSPPPLIGFDVAGADQISLVGAAFRKRAVHFLAIDGVFVIAAVGTAAEHDPRGAAVAALAQRRHPADGIAREKQQIHAGVAHLDDAVVLPAVPVFVVADADERLLHLSPRSGETMSLLET